VKQNASDSELGVKKINSLRIRIAFALRVMGGPFFTFFEQSNITGENPLLGEKFILH